MTARCWQALAKVEVITINYKDSTNEVLLDYYKENGFQKTVAVAKSMYNVNLKNAKKNFKTDMNGEVCETVLEIGILEFMKRYPKACEHWVLKKGLIIKDIEDPNNGFITEIDLVLATPQMIYLFECKSYTGNKVLTNEYTITTPARSFDVYKQNYLHAKTFLAQFTPYRCNKSSQVFPIQLALFSLAKGEIVDARTDVNKALMPLVEIEDLFDFLAKNIPTSRKKIPTLWKMVYVKEALDIISNRSDEYRSKHLKYVKKLHPKK